MGTDCFGRKQQYPNFLAIPHLEMIVEEALLRQIVPPLFVKL